MIGTAVRNRWDTDPRKSKAMETIDAALSDPDPKIALRAVAILKDMEAQNQRDEHKLIDVNVATRHDQVALLAADLGIEISVIEDASRQAGRGVGRIEEPAD